MKKIIYNSMPRVFHKLNHFRNHQNGYDAWLNNNFLFIHTPKAAGSSINKSLGMPDLGHYTYKELIKKNVAFEKKDFIFAVHRSPYSRIISTYNYALKNEKIKGYSSLSSILKYDSLEGFIKNKLKKLVDDDDYFFKSTVAMLKGVPTNKCYLINFDYIEDGYNEFFKDKSISVNPLSKINVSNDNEYNLSKECMDIISECYSDDLVLDGYLNKRKYILINEIESLKL